MTSGTPTEPNPHQIVQRVVPAARIVYADNDPVVLRYAEALLVSAAEGATDYLETDVREPRGVLQHACGFLDFERPVALPLVASLHSLGDDDDPYGVTRTLVDALPSGSLLVISHGTADFLDPEQAEKVTGTYRSGGITPRPRGRAEVDRFSAGAGERGERLPRRGRPRPLSPGRGVAGCHPLSRRTRCPRAAGSAARTARHTPPAPPRTR